MRIDGPGRPNGIGGPAGARRGGGQSSFALPEESRTARASTTPGAGGVYDVAALIALQAVEDPLQRRRRAVRRGFDLLDVLDSIRLDLLAGSVSPERLERLVGLLGKPEGAGDPKVDALIEEIELRARVELAKRGTYPD
ncbi:flagellar assembly protein FliX [Prosthecomicrobium sp. N25]|uniref:flagellar assembly protein FliX n=1 Tax=Prosthecomicrobium sp. N25 TaxID=3129254 RepID=UPI003076C00D